MLFAQQRSEHLRKRVGLPHKAQISRMRIIDRAFPVLTEQGVAGNVVEVFDPGLPQTLKRRAEGHVIRRVGFAPLLHQKPRWFINQSGSAGSRGPGQPPLVRLRQLYGLGH